MHYEEDQIEGGGESQLIPDLNHWGKFGVVLTWQAKMWPRGGQISKIQPSRIFRLRCGSKKMAEKYFEEENKKGRVEFVPVEWRSSLKLDEGVMDLVTPHTVRGVRNVINTSMMDIMYYTSPFYREEVSCLPLLFFIGYAAKTLNKHCCGNITFSINVFSCSPTPGNIVAKKNLLPKKRKCLTTNSIDSYFPQTFA